MTFDLIWTKLGDPIKISIRLKIDEDLIRFADLIQAERSLLKKKGEGAQLTYFLGGYVCQMTQNCDP